MSRLPLRPERAPGETVAPPSPARRAAYLHPGHLVAAREAHSLTTILGSCVAVCLWDPGLRVGGMNHFMLPTARDRAQTGTRFGDHAIRELIDRLGELGSPARALKAKVFGGACVMEAFRGGAQHLGAQNAELALREVRAAGIEIVAQDLGGSRGRKLIFHTDDGAALVRHL